MKKIFVLAMLAASLFSCSDDDDNNSEQAEAFFDFEVGDVWAYKYYQKSFSGEFVAENVIDTVKIVGTEVIEGKMYFDFETRSYSPLGEAHFIEHSYNRVDAEGHLVAPDGMVVHPGTDMTYTAILPQKVGEEEIGYNTTKLYTQSNIQVEGQSYEAYNYEAYFTARSSDLSGVGYQKYYSPGVGFVLGRYRYLSETDLSIEYRLVYHKK